MTMEVAAKEENASYEKLTKALRTDDDPCGAATPSPGDLDELGRLGFQLQGSLGPEHLLLVADGESPFFLPTTRKKKERHFREQVRRRKEGRNGR